MSSGWLKREVVLILLGILLASVAPVAAEAQGSIKLEKLNAQALKLIQSGEYDEATKIAKRSLALAEKLYSRDHPEAATALNILGQLRQITNRPTEAELLYRRALAIDEKSFGPEHPRVARDLNNVAGLLEATNRLTEAEPLYRRALAIDEKILGPKHPSVAGDLNSLAEMLQDTNRLAEAEPLMRRALAIDEKSLGPEHSTVATDLNNLALLLMDTNRLTEAEPLYRRALAIDEKGLGPEHPAVAVRLNNLAGLLQATNRLAEAEPLMRRALAIDEKSFGPEDPDVAIRLNNLAGLLQATNRLAEAEPLMRRALAIDEKSFGPEDPDVGIRLNNLAELLQATNRLAEAEPLYRRALAIDEKSKGPEDPDVARDLNNLAGLLQDTNRLAEAEPLYRRALAIDEKSFGPEDPDVGIRLNNLAELLQATNRLAEAEPLYRRALAIDEKSKGPEDPDVARDLNNLAGLLEATNRLTEAEPLYRRALAIDEKSKGPEDPDVARDLNNLAGLLEATNRLAEAEPLMRRALAIDEKSLGPEHSTVATDLNNLALLLMDTNRLTEAEPLYRRALAIDEKGLGPEHRTVATALNNLAGLLQATNRLAEAEPLMRRALAIDEKSKGPEHPDLARDLNNLAELLQDTNRLAEAEPLMRRALAIDEKSLGPEHPAVAIRLNNLAELLQATNRLAEAEPLMRRTLAIDEKSRGPEHPDVARDLNNLAGLLQDTNRLAQAEPLMRRALAIDEKSKGPEHPAVARDLNNLAGLLQDTNRLAEAEPLYRRALVIVEKGLGPDHPDVATTLNNLAGLLQATNRLAEAELLMQRALAINEKSKGPEHPDVAIDLNGLAELFEERGDWAGALALHALAKPIMIGRGSAETIDRIGLAKVTLAQSTWDLRAYARAVYRVDPGKIAEGFELAQWALQTEAADAIAQMAARFEKGNGPLAEVVREQQDLMVRRRGEDKRLLTAAGRADAKGVEQSRAAVADIDQRLDVIDAQLAHDFKDYADLTNPKPLSIAATQALLRDDETLILFLDVRVPQFGGKLPEETLVWVVTDKEARWRSTPLGTSALADRVTALRCGLDNSNWIDPAKEHWLQLTDEDKAQWQGQEGKRDHCKQLLGREVSERDPPPFNFAIAHELYQALLEPFADEIKDKKLLVVPSGPLSSLPLQVLITKEPTAPYASSPDDYRDAAWLIKEHAITVLPSVASLASLRSPAKVNQAEAQSDGVSNATPTSDVRQPFIGFGDPLVFGPAGIDRRAEEKQSCAKATRPANQEVAEVEPAGGPISRGGLANVSDIKRQYPLPDTAVELCEVAHVLGAPESDVYLGERATVTAVKEAPLDHYRIVQFATHGLLSSETAGFGRAAEGALVLTPPAMATDTDDGLFTASEVAQLKLNADWVVLSACNTAAGDKPGAEPLSGLASAFFYARARALLVSHWYVNSHAAAQITTGAFEALEKEPAIGYAEAFRRSMLAMMQHPNWQDKKLPAAHPAVWAPFSLVGEGGASANIGATSSQMSASPQKP